MKDTTESIRREMIEMNYPEAASEKAFKRWNTLELQRDFIVHSFIAPFVVVTRLSDGAKGTLMFTHSPREYFNFTADEGSS